MSQTMGAPGRGGRCMTMPGSVNSGVWSRVKGVDENRRDRGPRRRDASTRCASTSASACCRAPARTASGYRDYAPDTVERIRLTRELQAIGFTLSDVVDALAAHDAGGATCESERWRLDAVLDRVDARLAELAALRGRIVDAQQACAAGRCRLTNLTTSASTLELVEFCCAPVLAARAKTATIMALPIVYLMAHPSRCEVKIPFAAMPDRAKDYAIASGPIN